MATGTFTYMYNALHAKRAYKNIKKNCKSFRLYKSNAVSIGTTAVKPYLSICPECYNSLVCKVQYCGKMCSRHLFSYDGFRALYFDVLTKISKPLVKPVVSIEYFEQNQ